MDGIPQRLTVDRQSLLLPLLFLVRKSMFQIDRISLPRTSSMTNEFESNNTAETSLRYAGWPVVLASFFGVMVSFAAVVPYTFSLFLAPLHEAFGWQREAISIAFAIAAMTVAFCSPGIGHLLDRYPPRRIILPAIVLFSAGVASLAFLGSHIIQFYLSYLLLGIVGNATAQLAYSRSVSTWFVARRGLAFAVTLTGSGVGSILLPLIAQRTLELYGWRSAYLVLGGLALLVAFPLTAIFVREKPTALRCANHPSSEGMSVSQALSSKIFWILMASILLYAFSANGVIAHLSAILTNYGVPAHSAALALSVLGASGIIGRLITGHFLDRCFAPRVSLVMLLLCSGSLILLAHAHSATTGIAAALMLGFGLGSESDVTPFLIARYCGLKNFSMLYGLSWTAYAFGAAFGPVLVGKAFDKAGAYQSSFVMLLSLPCLAGALLTLLLPRYAPQSTPETTLDVLVPSPSTN
jgi:MFS family permease